MLIPYAKIDALLAHQIVAPGVAPGATACVSVRVTKDWVHLLGAAGRRSQERPDQVHIGTIYDLASVTKPFFAITLARFAEQGALSLQESLSDLLPELKDTAAASAPLELLLAHRAGLEAHRSLYRDHWQEDRFLLARALRESANARRDECRDELPKQGFAPLYSDLGYLLLGAGLERRLARPLDALFAEQLSQLGLFDLASSRIWKTREAKFEELVAPTETVEWRGGREVIGAVHDDNAWAASGSSSSGHAGLFGTAAAVARFGTRMLDAVRGDTSVLSGCSVATLLGTRPGGSLLAGFDTRSDHGSSISTHWSRDSFGHLGFTGTSLWCDPQRQLVVVLLCNRVCPSRDNLRIRQARPIVHDALAEFGLEWR